MNKLAFAAVSALAAGVLATPASAAVTLTFSQSGNNVVAQLSGSLDTTGLVFSRLATSGAVGGVAPSSSSISIGPRVAPVNDYTLTATGPAAYGTAGFIQADSFAGDAFFFNRTILSLPRLYVSGAALSSTATFNNRTLASFGLTSGNSVYTIGQDTLTVVGGGAVPEPATWAMMLAGFGLVGAGLRSRRRSVTFANA